MGNSTTKTAIGVAVLYALSALPALAADIILKVDNEKHTVAVTNTLPTKVTMLFLEAPGITNLPVYAQLEKGATVNVPLRFVMPASVSNAICDVDGQHRLLTVELK